MINFDLKKIKSLKPGCYFGGIKPGTRQYAHFETKFFNFYTKKFFLKKRQICYFAILKYEYYCMLKDGFKEWAEKLQINDDQQKIETLSKIEYFDKSDDMVFSLRVPLNIEGNLDVTDDLLIVLLIIFLILH